MTTALRLLLAAPLAASLPLSAGDSMGQPTGNSGDFMNSPAVVSPWEVTAAASVALAQGNSDSMSYALQGLATYQGDVWEGLVGADYLYSENNGSTTSDSLRIFGQGQRLLTDRLYLGLAGAYYTDEQSDLDYRVDVAGILGYHVIKSDSTKLSFEVGPGYAWEEQGADSESYATIRFGQRFEQRLSANSKLWQSAILTPQIDDFGDYFLTVDAGLDVRLTDQWGFRTGVRYRYDSTPAAGRGEDDYSLLAGLTYALGGLPTEDAPAAGRASLFPGEEVSADPLMGWTTTAALGISLAKGNSDNLQATLSYDSAYRASQNELFFNAIYSYAQDEGDTSADALRASVQYNRLLSERLYVGGSLSFLRDELADVSYRLTPSAVVGYYVIKNDDVTLSFEGGPAFIFEEVAGEENNYFALRAAERLTWNLGPRLSLNQALVIDAEAGNFENYLATLSGSLDAKFTQNLAWRLAATYVYDNEPGAGLEEDDLTLTSGIAVKF